MSDMPETTARAAKRRDYKVVKRTVKSRQRVRFGNYRRARLVNPRTGRVQSSYMYRTKGGKLKRIPLAAIAGSDKEKEAILKARQKAAKRLIEQGGAFVANRRSKKRRTGTKRRSTKRSAAAKKAARTRAAKKAVRSRAAKKAARTRKRRAAGRTATPKRRKARRSTKRARAAAPKRRKARKARRSTRKTKRVSAKARRSAAAKKAARTRKRRAAARSAAPKRRRSSKARRTRKGTRMRANRRRRGTRRLRANGRRRSRRRMRRNQLGALFMKVVKSGALVGLGYISHRLLTNAICNHLLPMLKGSSTTTETGTVSFSTFEKPLVGAALLIPLVPLTNLVAKKAVIELSGGMVASELQALLTAVFEAAGLPTVAGQLAGYQSGAAWQLRGRGLRGNSTTMAGLGGVRGRRSIMPRYAPVGAFRQAAAGTGTYRFRQAAAGLSEYFAPNAVGEYFAPSGVQGVGQYEPAGPLAMQASAGIGEIDDGIRPDTNMDAVLDLAESAAGYRSPRGMRGMGEYLTATRNNGGWDETRVPTQDQWVPSGPLWAGTLGVKDTGEQSELPAGILAGPGGNGSLSG